MAEHRKLIERDAAGAADLLTADGTPWNVYGLGVEASRDLIAAGIRRGEALVGEFAGIRLAGWIWFQERGTFHHAGYIRVLVVGAGDRRGGVASRLMDAAEETILAKSGSVFLLVSEWNQAARSFYQRRGYLEVGRLDGYVRAGSTEIICWKSTGQPLEFGAS
jgi:ribosomal protein S18 acetylase RimI-like enzyme